MQLDYDPRIISYAELVAMFEKGHRPGGYGQYRTANLTGQPFYRAEDYHQKYYLRHDSTLMREFASYTPRQFVDSTVAARLNGARYGRIDIEPLGLSQSAVEYLVKVQRSR